MIIMYKNKINYCSKIKTKVSLKKLNQTIVGLEFCTSKYNLSVFNNETKKLIFVITSFIFVLKICIVIQPLIIEIYLSIEIAVRKKTEENCVNVGIKPQILHISGPNTHSMFFM